LRRKEVDNEVNENTKPPRFSFRLLSSLSWDIPSGLSLRAFHKEIHLTVTVIVHNKGAAGKFIWVVPSIDKLVLTLDIISGFLYDGNTF
jgi:hypothetical protein